MVSHCFKNQCVFEAQLNLAQTVSSRHTPLCTCAPHRLSTTSLACCLLSPNKTLVTFPVFLKMRVQDFDISTVLFCLDRPLLVCFQEWSDSRLVVTTIHCFSAVLKQTPIKQVNKCSHSQCFIYRLKSLRETKFLLTHSMKNAATFLFNKMTSSIHLRV